MPCTETTVDRLISLAYDAVGLIFLGVIFLYALRLFFKE